MTSLNLIRRLHQHRMWAIGRLLYAVQDLTEEELQRPLPIGQGSVWRTLTHLIAADFAWIEALEGNPEPLFPGDVPGRLPGNQAGSGTLRNLAELRTRWAEIDAHWERSLQGLAEESLTDLVEKVSTSSAAGKRFSVRRSDILMHVCLHSQYTVAQLVNMLRQLGRSPAPDVMLITLARSELADAGPPGGA
ncbi:MAG: DinB family protein [Planctomyces sp.]|nr:DinB family protein [Planctomyces sp.]